ncbi:Bpu10I family restriction endonuclease [Sphaerospermopsis sp. LEGE 00249]|uniref:Bpu10I family restriction endonuclease n=1 Tax=Sphaerospermopsis sp. LEGE 00249 TaxID=1380707 RepID=UPI0021051C7B|nr:Bpu10I family restriction endonuclease [Sphaerospermopsis sp. LEGE 00249]
MTSRRMHKNYPTPHLEKLNALLDNSKIPVQDKPRVTEAIDVYYQWINDLTQTVELLVPADEMLNLLIKLLIDYKKYIDIDLIFDSPNDFLYRQKGQLKLDNTIIEEFLPYLINPVIVPEIANLEVDIGPIKAFSSVYFESSLTIPALGGGLSVRTKNQDFAITRKLYLKASHFPDFQQEKSIITNLAYIAVECKTNLDKTMFQEGCATAHDVKTAVPGAKYFLLCEWLDMSPISTAPTDIDEVILLRKAKRLNSNIRKNFATYQGRLAYRENYIKYLENNPFRVEVFQHFISNIRKLLKNEGLDESNVLEVGYF